MRTSRLTVIAVVAAVLTTAVAHGVVTNRWSGGDGAPVIPAVPPAMGDWVGEDQKSDVDDPGLANLTRRYTHARTGRDFVISLTVGHPGLTGIHTPEYCYRGSGYAVAAPILRRPVEVAGGPPAEFWTTQFQKQTAAGTEQLRVFWAWSAGGGWAAPKWDPRFTFLGKPRLYKLYVIGAGLPDVTPGKDPLLDQFLASLLGTLNHALFAPPAS
jgi:hypothetical protein